MATQALRDTKPLEVYAMEADSDEEIEIESEKEQEQGFENIEEEFDDDRNVNKEEEEDLEQDNEKMKDLLFFKQGIGAIKKVEDYDVYVKHDQAEYGLKQILRELRLDDSSSRPFVKLMLAEWKFLENDLVPLLIYHKKDKHLSFFTVKLMFKLTQVP